MLRGFLTKVLVCAVAVYAADYFLAGFSVADGIRGYLIAGLVLGALNTFIRPILKLLAFPLIMLSLGFFTFVINAGILWFVAEVVDLVAISGLWSLVWATFIISGITMVFEPRTKHS